MDGIPLDEQELALSNQQLMQFGNVRKRYKNTQQLNELVISGIKGENYLNVRAADQHIIRELMTEPDKRARHQIDVLVKATSNLPFFMEMLHNGRFNEHQIQERICKKLVHVDEAAGRAIIRRSSSASPRREGRQVLHHPQRPSRHLQEERKTPDEARGRLLPTRGRGRSRESGPQRLLEADRVPGDLLAAD